MDPTTTTPPPHPSILRLTLGFLLVGMAWGLTTPFIRLAAVHYRPSPHASLSSPHLNALQKRIYKAWFTVCDLLKNPRYAVPLVVNLSGSVWFFLLVGKTGTWFCSTFLFSIVCGNELLRWGKGMGESAADSGVYMSTELSLTVPITNSMAFLFTVLGDWWAEKKVISRGKHRHTHTHTRSLSLPIQSSSHSVVVKG